MAVIEYKEDDTPGPPEQGCKGAKRAAFSLIEGTEQTIIWRGELNYGPTFCPYVIKSIHGAIQDPKKFEFSFMKADGTFGPKTHTIDLDDENLVWKGLPSTLLDLSEATPHAFLFLTKHLQQRARELHEDGAGPQEPKVAGPGTGGNGKWPRAAGMLMVSRQELEEIVQKAVQAVLAEFLPGRETP